MIIHSITRHNEAIAFLQSKNLRWFTDYSIECIDFDCKSFELFLYSKKARKLETYLKLKYG